MMKSHSEHLSENKRPWSVMPMRAFGDKELKERELRVLGALCAFTNRAGVCWPSMETLCNVSGYKERKSVHDAMKRLKARKYVRQLDPKEYQKAQSGWKTNRYQVLWDGDEPLPTYEQIHIAKPLQLRSDQEDTPIEEKGIVRGADSVGHTQAEAICWTFIRAVEQWMGQRKLFDNEVAHAHRLYLRGATPDQVKDATVAVCTAAIKGRQGVPSLADVIRWMDVHDDKG